MLAQGEKSHGAMAISRDGIVWLQNVEAPGITQEQSLMHCLLHHAVAWARGLLAVLYLGFPITQHALSEHLLCVKTNQEVRDSLEGMVNYCKDIKSGSGM